MKGVRYLSVDHGGIKVFVSQVCRLGWRRNHILLMGEDSFACLNPANPIYDYRKKSFQMAEFGKVDHQ